MPHQDEDPSDLPPEIECLVGKSLLFKVQINKDNIEDPEGTKFHVQRICNDDKVIKAFMNKNLIQQVSPEDPSVIYFLV